MSDALNQAAAALQSKMAGVDFDGSVKFAIEGEGAIRVADGTVSVDDGDADCTITAALDVFHDLFQGELDPTAAFMTGKIRVDGDMGIAMKLGQILG